RRAGRYGLRRGARAPALSRAQRVCLQRLQLAGPGISHSTGHWFVAALPSILSRINGQWHALRLFLELARPPLLEHLPTHQKVSETPDEQRRREEDLFEASSSRLRIFAVHREPLLRAFASSLLIFPRPPLPALASSLFVSITAYAI